MLIAGIAATAALLALPTVASALVYCVPNATIDPSCNVAQGTVQGALTAAQSSTAVADTVRLGPGNFGNPTVPAATYTGSGANTLQLIGAGTSQTIWTMNNIAGSTTGLDLTAPAGSTISHFTMVITEDADTPSDVGIELQGNPAASRVAISGPTVENTTGFRVSQSDSTPTIDESSVSMNQASVDGTEAIGGTGSPTITDSTISGTTGISHGGSGQTATVRRSVFHASQFGLIADSGTLDVSETVIDLTGSIGAAGVVPSNVLNSGVSPISAVVDGVTIVNGGAGSSGILARADSEHVPPPGNGGTDAEKNDMVNDGETSTATVANTVISGIAHPLDIEADRGEVASITASYSNYDPAGNIQDSDISNGNATGTATLTETNGTSFAPGFVDSGSGDYHLLSSSPLLEIGDPAPPSGSATDIDGDPRVLLGKPACAPRRDIGADEFRPSPAIALLDCLAPDSQIAGKRKLRTRRKKARATFTLTSTERGASFECSIDSKPFVPCSSPFSTKIRIGKHLLTVRSTDTTGNVDATPATFVVKVKRKVPAL